MLPLIAPVADEPLPPPLPLPPTATDMLNPPLAAPEMELPPLPPPPPMLLILTLGEKSPLVVMFPL